MPPESYYSDDWLTVYEGDCRAVMAGMEPESVSCVVTSPPYWGLRDYGTATWIGGDEGCDHLGVKRMSDKTSIGRSKGKDRRLLPHAPSANVQMPYRDMCGKCGAVRQDSQLGLEPTPEEYVANMVAVFREVRRVLRSDGTVWLNLGDSYAANGISGLGVKGDTSTLDGAANNAHTAQRKTVPFGLKPKDLVGVPWRVAFALQADGWYLRSDIIWSKPNPMPESVTDRPTKSHEYLFLLTKSARYYFDADAVRDAHTTTVHRLTEPTTEHGNGVDYRDMAGGRPRNRSGKALAYAYADGVQGNPAGRNIRSVWTVATQPYPGAHFATFPEALVEPCIKAGCPQQGVVLDPFAGSGTVGRVAQRLSRRAVLIDLNADYLVQAMARNADIPLGLETA